MKTVHEVSKLTGVSVRALHHYDSIGLLKPAKISEAGYRLYDDASLLRLQQIMLFRELRFPLKDIRRILDSPDFDASEALETQIKLLELQRERLSEIIDSARELQRTGVKLMKLEKFSREKIEEYEAEAKKRWGGTSEYAEFAKKPKDGVREASEGLMELFARFGVLVGTAPASDEAISLAGELRQYISENFYDCSKEVFASLGQMYTADSRFRDNIDSKGGAGTAEFASAAIEEYCRR